MHSCNEFHIYAYIISKADILLRIKFTLLHTLILTMQCVKITSNDYQLIYYIKHDEINAHTFLSIQNRLNVP